MIFATPVFPEILFTSLLASAENRGFFIFKKFRKLPIANKTAYIEQIFHIIYTERETIPYVVDTLNIDQKLAISVFRILNYSEDMIVNRCMSRRRFMETLNDITGISKEEIDFIWMLYQEHLADVEPVVHSKKLLYLEQKISNLAKQITCLTDYLSYITDSIDLISLDETDETTD